MQLGNKEYFMPKFTINKIHCIETSESGEDEIFFKFLGNDVLVSLPKQYDIDDGQIIQVEVMASYKGDLTVELWEYDSSSPDDLLGSITVNENSKGEYTSEANGDGGKYRITYTVS
jgi:hypothetical protein